MKTKHLLIPILMLMSSCDFNINDSPGPQLSSSVKEAQSHGTYLGTYYLKGNKLNGVAVSEIFAEKVFWREDNLALRKKIDCCESQLVIVSKQPFTVDGNGYAKDWKLIGFKQMSSFKIFTKLKTITLPDSVMVTFVNTANNDTAALTLYRMK